MNSPSCALHDGNCKCSTAWSPVQQSLEEVEFMRSACAAAKSGHVARLRAILDTKPEAVHGDGVDGSSGYTPLHYASRAGYKDAVELLVERGAKVDQKTKAGGATSLHRAAYMGHTDIVAILLSCGANGTIQDNDGETALHKAANQGHFETVKLLMTKCPEAASICDRYGRAASHVLAQMEEHLDSLAES